MRFAIGHILFGFRWHFTWECILVAPVVASMRIVLQYISSFPLVRDGQDLDLQAWFFTDFPGGCPLKWPQDGWKHHGNTAAGPFFTEGSVTKNSPGEGADMMRLLEEPGTSTASSIVGVAST